MSDQEAAARAATPQASNDERSSQGQRPQQQPEGVRGGGSRSRRRHRPQHNQQTTQPQPRPERSLNMEEVRELVELFTEHGLTEFELEREDFSIRLGRNSAASQATPQTSSAATAPAAPAHTQHAAPPAASTTSSVQPTATPHPGAAAERAASEDEDLQIITSPILGTFYRSPSPTAEPFVRIGSHVEPEMVVCIIEAMKLMNEILAETRGEVVKIYVENGQAVEYGQPLFGVRKQ